MCSYLFLGTTESELPCMNRPSLMSQYFSNDTQKFEMRQGLQRGVEYEYRYAGYSGTSIHRGSVFP